MAVTEKRRQGLANRADQVLGAEHGETLMELLPPVGWADIATKRDLTQAIEFLDARVEAKLTALEARIERSIRTSVLTGMAVQTAVVGVLLAVA